MVVSAEIVALIAAAVAVFAAVLSVRATALVARAVFTSRDEAGRNASSASDHPVRIRVVEGHTRREIATDARHYAFMLAISNPSGTDRRLTAVTLRVTYRTRANFLGAVDLHSDAAIEVAAGTSVDTTLRFTTSNVIPRHCRIDAYTLFFLDEKGVRLTVDASLPPVLQADTDGTGPPTWGWD